MFTNTKNKLKVGFPLYLNTLPFLFYLKNTDYFELCSDIPRKLNYMLKNGKLHCALSSSVFFAKNFEDFVLIPDVSISAVGKVKSVILFHKEKLEKLNKKKIGITPETESSFLLLRVLLEDFLNVYPEYVSLSKNWNDLSLEEKEELCGYLAIGDEALNLSLSFNEKTSENKFITDLAELWLEYTNLPFIFALLCIKKEVIPVFKEELKRFSLDLYYARARAFSDLRKIVEQSHLNLPKEFAYTYLTHLEFDFSGLKQKAFLYFCECLKRKQILKEVPELRFLEI
jgi:chorismate dehydratase